jgi:hypothetical protein
VFRITKDWIEAHQSNQGGWTRDQVQAIGLDWPLVKGWKWKVIGLQITDETKARFEQKLDRKAARHQKTVDLFGNAP